MEKVSVVLIVAMLFTAAVAGDASSLPYSVAHKAFPKIVWREKGDMISGDINCDGKNDYALIGDDHAHEKIVVAVLLGSDDLLVPQKLWTVRRSRFVNMDSHGVSGEVSANTLRFEAESLDDSDKDLKEMLAVVPEGYKRSVYCKGMVITDTGTDPIHLYWDHKNNTLNSWSL